MPAKITGESPVWKAQAEILAASTEGQKFFGIQFAGLLSRFGLKCQ
jgi:hypothetical protein